MNELYWEMLHEVKTALNELSLPSTCLLAQSDADQVVAAVTREFVIGPVEGWWWLRLRGQTRVYSYPEGDGFRHLEEYAQGDNCWLIIDYDFWEREKIVLEAGPKDATRILGQLWGVEYYLADRSFRWLLGENHHNQLIVLPHIQLDTG